MKKFIKKLLAFILIFLLFDRLFFLFLVLSPTLEKDDRLEKVLKGEMHNDIVVFGSSRGARNIIAGQIGDSLRLSVYNLSYPGSDVSFHEFLLRSYLRFNEKPKIVLLAIDDPSQLLPDESINFRYDRLYPLARYSHINNEMIEHGRKTWLSKVIVLARINKRNFDIRMKTYSAYDSLSACGSMPIAMQRDDQAFKFDNSAQSYTTEFEREEKKAAFKKFQDLCAKNGLKLVLVFPPNFKLHNVEFENRIREMSSVMVNYYIYNSENEIYSDKTYFFDESHLRKNGASIFTNELVNYLRMAGL
jgi:hypothetical protein